MEPKVDRYTHGHHDSVLRSHRWRTAENSAGFLLPHLHAGQDLLDIGCGPGTITLDLARYVAPGRTVGVDLSPEVIEEARRLQEGGVTSNAVFAVESVYQLSFEDSSFDVVYAHQVLQHLSDPVSALVEMRRVLREGGVLAVRDADFGAFAWAPRDPRLNRWIDIYHRITAANHAEADAGRLLPTWVREAGFKLIDVSSSNWTFYEAHQRQWWGQLWADRVRHSEFARQGIEYSLTTVDELDDIAAAFLRWASDEDGVFIAVHGEVIATP